MVNKINVENRFSSNTVIIIIIAFIYISIRFLFFPVEELLCLATWKDGSTKYMIGKLEHTPTSSDEDKYRCFVVGKSIGGSFEMAQSGDATCNGMSSPTDGSRTMKFNRGKGEWERERERTLSRENDHFKTQRAYYNAWANADKDDPSSQILAPEPPPAD